MRGLIFVLVLFWGCAVMAQGQRPSTFPEKATASATDAIYTQEDGTNKKVLFSTARRYFGARVVTVSTPPAPTGNAEGLRNRLLLLVPDSVAYFVDWNGDAVLLGGGAAEVELREGPPDTLCVADNCVVLPAVPASLPPSGPAGGSLTGTYPNPGLGINAVEWNILSAAARDSILARLTGLGTVGTYPIWTATRRLENGRLANITGGVQVTGSNQFQLGAWTLDPAGVAGGLGYRSDLGVLRYYDGVAAVWRSVPTASVVAGQVVFGGGGASLLGNNNLFWDNVNKRLGVGTPTPLTTLDIRVPNIGASFPVSSGLWLVNPTLSTAMSNQNTPSIRIEGSGWKTNAVASSQNILFQVYGRSFTGTTSPSGLLSFGAGTNNVITDGILTVGTNGNVGVGVGVSALPSSKLHVLGTVLASLYSVNFPNSSGVDYGLEINRTSGAFDAQSGSGLGVRFQNRQVVGTWTPDFFINRVVSNVSGTVTTGFEWWLHDNQSSSLNSVIALVLNGRRLGVGGVGDPTQALHVMGNARVTGAYFDSNNTAGSAQDVLKSTGTVSVWTAQRNNVASGTTDGAGDITITFATAMPDATYSAIVTLESPGAWIVQVHSKTTNACKVRFYQSTTGLEVSAGNSATVSYQVTDY